MRSAKAVFIKQAKDTIKNKVMLIQYLLFPLMAYVMTELVARADETIPDSIFVTMFAALFTGMTPLMATNTAIAEDKECKALRLLVMAGVKPYEYLIGIGGFMFLICLLISVLFAVIGGFAGVMFLKFVLVLMLGSTASALLGSIVGIFSKNQQSATATATPLFLVLAFCPMLAMFNETIANMSRFLFTFQVNVLVNDLQGNLMQPLWVILVNIAVFVLLFAFAYKKKGLRG